MTKLVRPMFKSPKAVRQAWVGAKQRCENPQNKSYPSYGGRGIKVCSEWQLYSNFRKDMGLQPVGTILDRIDVNGDYSPDNCRWASHEVSGLNRREFAAETFIRVNNTSGAAGVHFDGYSWVAKAQGKVLYRGDSFLDAVCFRKSWEVKQTITARGTLCHQ